MFMRIVSHFPPKLLRLRLMRSWGHINWRCVDVYVIPDDVYLETIAATRDLAAITVPVEAVYGLLWRPG